MIVSKLSQVLFERQLKISDVARETGITRPTLTSLYSGKSKGINFDTLDKLCKFFSLTPNELFAFYDFEFDNVLINTLNSDMFLNAVLPSVKLHFVSSFPVFLGFYGGIPLKGNKFEPIKFIGYFTNIKGKSANHLDVRLCIYSLPTEEMKFLASSVAKTLIYQSLHNVIDTNFSNIYSLTTYSVIRNLENFEQDFNIDNVTNK